MKRKILWLMYRKLRPAFGIPLAFVLMTGIFLNVLNTLLIMTALGFFFIDLFGNFYNDYWDFAEDVKNNRKDKFTTCGILSAKKVLCLSMIFASVGILFLLFTNMSLIFLGVFYTFLLFIYSHNRVRLKGKVVGYCIVSFPYFLLPIVISHTQEIPILNALPLSLFFYFQCAYILCQKDSTEMKEYDNLFTNKGWKKSSEITIFFGICSSTFLLFLCLLNPILILVWLFNGFSKFLNLDNIRKRTITTHQRRRYVLMEFMTPYFYLVGGFL